MTEQDLPPSFPRRPPRLNQVYIQNPLYLVTCCTLNRQTALANPTVMSAVAAASDKMHRAGNALGRYVIMPDHIHVFMRIGPEGRLGLAVKCLKETITKVLHREQGTVNGIWQDGFFDHLLRSSESYAEKWAYVRENPVRAGLATTPDDWPYQGECSVIRW